MMLGLPKQDGYPSITHISSFLRDVVKRHVGLPWF